MLCQNASELLSKQLDCSLSEAERSELDAHLSECEQCQDKAIVIRHMDSIYSRVKPAQPPPEFANKVMVRIHRRNLWHSAWHGSVTLIGISLLVIAALGALVLALSPLISSAAQYPALADAIYYAQSLAAVLHTFGHAIRMTISAMIKSGFPFIIIGYLMLAVFLITWWTRVLFTPKPEPGQAVENRNEQGYGSR